MAGSGHVRLITAGMRIQKKFLVSGSGSAEEKNPDPTFIRNENKYVYISGRQE